VSKPRILLVDDDPDILDVLEITLAEENYEILKAGDGEEAIRIIQSKPLDLVLLDYNMPKMNGQQVCLKVKQDLLLRHIPIIMVTGKGEISDKVGGINAGADDYIVKPFEPKELLARIRMILRRTERGGPRGKPPDQATRQCLYIERAYQQIGKEDTFCSLLRRPG